MFFQLVDELLDKFRLLFVASDTLLDCDVDQVPLGALPSTGRCMGDEEMNRTEQTHCRFAFRRFIALVLTLCVA
jgi:hypothetical protein